MRAAEQQQQYPGHFRKYHRDLGKLGRLVSASPGQVLLTLSPAHQPRVALIMEGTAKLTAASDRAGSAAKAAGVLLSLHRPGSLIGEEAAFAGPAGLYRRHGRNRILQVTAVTGLFASVFDVKKMRWYLRDHPDAMAEITAGICARLAEAQDRIAVSRDSANQRLARFLYELTADPDTGSEVSALSQADIASWVGASRETLGEVLRGWRERDFISTRHRSIIVRDRAALARIAGLT